MKTQENSFEEYKKYLQNSLGESSLPQPRHPMNPYLRFYLERSSEERTKGEKDWNALAKTLALEWKDLAANKKEFYEKIYSIRMRERNALMQEYLRLSGKQKILAPYARFVKKRYAQYSKQYKNSTSSQINKLIKNDWKNLSQKEKTKLTDEFQREKNDASLDIDNTERAAEYQQRLEKYHQLLKEDREKILKKYGITKESKAKLKREEKEQERLKKRAQRNLQLEQRRREKQQEKRKLREAKLKKLRDEREAQRKLKDQQKQRQKEERQKAKVQQAEKKKREAENKKKPQKPALKPAVKAEEKKSKSKPKTTEKVQVKKTEAKKPTKTKKIAKKTKESKKVKQTSKAKNTKSKAKPKPKAKAKGRAKKAKSAKGAKRGRK